MKTETEQRKRDERLAKRCAAFRIRKAAPELLAALENTLNELEHWHGWQIHASATYSGSDGFRVCSGRIERARAAIAKAKGQP